MKVICDKKDCCGKSEGCGGAEPHEFDESECGKCPMDKSARCIPYYEIEELLNDIKTKKGADGYVPVD